MAERLNIVLSPHFDDAVFSLGGLIATAPQRAVVITVFAGTPAAGVCGRWDRRSGFKTAVEAMDTRRRENAAALAVLGVPPSGILDLDFLDRQYRSDDPSGASIKSALAEALRPIVRRYGPASDLYTPASAWHPDHALLTDAVLKLWQAGDWPGGDVFLYQDQPYAYLELRRRSLAPLRFAPLTIAETWHGLATRPVWLGFDRAQAAQKRRAAERYKSQFPVVRHLIFKMIDDFSRHQARAAGLSAPNAEMVYRLARHGLQS